jgi:hypothetical protein
MEAEVQRVQTKIGALGALSHKDKGYAKALLNEDPTRVQLFEDVVEDKEILGAVNLMFQRAKGEPFLQGRAELLKGKTDLQKVR